MTDKTTMDIRLNEMLRLLRSEDMQARMTAQIQLAYMLNETSTLLIAQELNDPDLPDHARMFLQTLLLSDEHRSIPGMALVYASLVGKLPAEDFPFGNHTIISKSTSVRLTDYDLASAEIIQELVDLDEFTKTVRFSLNFTAIVLKALGKVGGEEKGDDEKTG